MLISAAALAEKVLVFMDPAVTVKENYEFRRIYRKGKSAVSPQLVIYCQRNRRGHSRLGVSVSTKLGCASPGTRSSSASAGTTACPWNSFFSTLRYTYREFSN